MDQANSGRTEMLQKLKNSLETFLEQYNDEISHVDFRLNTSKVVADVKKTNQKFYEETKID